MDAFITKKRPLADVDTNNNNLAASPPSSSLSQSSFPPTKKAKTAAKASELSAKPSRAKKTSAKPKAAKTIGHCSLNKKEFGDKIKDCLALEKYEVQRMSFKVRGYHLIQVWNVLTVANNCRWKWMLHSSKTSLEIRELKSPHKVSSFSKVEGAVLNDTSL
jgi:hypothetical protein